MREGRKNHKYGNAPAWAPVEPTANALLLYCWVPKSARGGVAGQTCRLQACPQASCWASNLPEVLGRCLLSGPQCL